MYVEICIRSVFFISEIPVVPVGICIEFRVVVIFLYVVIVCDFAENERVSAAVAARGLACI